jgi:hypothetical protein
VRERAGVAGPGRDQSGRLGFDGFTRHGQPGPACDQQDAMRGRRGVVCGGDPAAQPGQRDDPVRHGGLRGAARPQDTILSLAERLAKYGRRGTDYSLPLVQANGNYGKRPFAGCVLVSDNESWVYAGRAFGYGRQGATGVMQEWQKFVANQQRLGNDGPKLVCIDLHVYTTTQAPEREGILNVGGFSNAVFHAVASYLADDAARFVAEVESIEL